MPERSASARETLHGLLAVDKPAGPTSHDIVARVRRLAGQRQVGHGGTLDPLATGVLVLGLGAGTRMLEYLTRAPKRYLATIRFGSATDTYDATGNVTATAERQHLTPATIAAALASFRGTFQQRPPAFSAVKREGRAAYIAARRGETVELAPRQVTIYRLEIVEIALPDVTLDVTCSGGTYIRSLAHDLGQALGSAAHLAALRRTEAGGFTLAEALPLAALEAGGRDIIAERLWAPDRALLSAPALILSPESAARIAHGALPPVAPPPQCDAARVYDAEGTLIAIAIAAGGRWQGLKVLSHT